MLSFGQTLFQFFEGVNYSAAIQNSATNFASDLSCELPFQDNPYNRRMQFIGEPDSGSITRLGKQHGLLLRIHQANLAENPHQPCDEVVAQQSDGCATDSQ